MSKFASVSGITSPRPEAEPDATVATAATDETEASSKQMRLESSMVGRGARLA